MPDSTVEDRALVPVPTPDHHKLPRFFGDGGYEWINYLTDRAREGRSNWQVTAHWGTQGWDLGEWPLVVVAIYPDESGKFFSVSLYVEGDVTVANSGEITAISGGSVAVGVFARADYGTATIVNTGDITASDTGINGFYGYSVSSIGIVIGAFWGLLEGFVHFGLFAWLYNMLLGRS